MTSGSPNMRSFAKDRTVADHKLTRDTLHADPAVRAPVPRQARGLRRASSPLEAAAGAVTPLLFKTLIDDGITAGNTEVVLTDRRGRRACSRSSPRACPSPTAGCRRRWARG